MIQLPEDLELTTQEKVIDIIEALQAVSKPLWVGLVTSIILIIPLNLFIKFSVSNVLIRAYSPPDIIYIAPDPEDIKIIDKNIFSPKKGRYFAYARIANPNVDLAVRNLEFEFILTNRAGEVVRKFESSSYILPDQDKLIFMPVTSISDEPVNLEVNLLPERWSKFSDFQRLDFQFENINFGREDSQFFASTIIRNNNPYTISEIEISVLLYDIDQNVIGVNFTTVNNVKLLEGRFFRVIWPTGIDGSVSNIEFKPAVNLFNSDALVTESAGAEEQFGR